MINTLISLMTVSGGIAMMIYIVYVLIDILILLLVAEAVISWIPSLRESPVGNLLRRLTGPVVAPMRLLLSKIGAFRGFPIDFSVFFTIILLTVLQVILRAWL